MCARHCIGAWLLWCALALIPQSSVALEPPALKARVNDLAGLLDVQAQTALEQTLAAYEARTGHQFALLIIPSLQGDPLEDFSIRVVEQWKLGDAKRDDGLLMLIALKDRKVRIEVGYGLEGAIPDAVAKRVIEDFITPSFKAERYAEGIHAGFDALMKAAEHESLGAPPHMQRRVEGSGWMVLSMMLFFVALVLGRVSRFVRVPLMGSLGVALGYFVLHGVLGMVFGGLVGFMLSMLPAARGRGFPLGPMGGGGGFGGGGFGGGGGGFGGGGASGGW